MNYGSLGLLDYLHGTDEKFRENKAYERHITLTSLQSARELFPDNWSFCFKNKYLHK